MMKKIIPALLTDNIKTLQKMWEICKEFADYVQIDIMDGKFVPSRSVSIEDIKNVELDNSIDSEAHLMVERPQDWIGAFKKLGSKKIIFHFEIKEDKEKIINSIRKEKMSVGLAINPDTPIEMISEWVGKVDFVLFMAVNPGFYGSKFIPEVLDKIREFRRVFKDYPIGIDGGVKLDNIREVASSGVNYICVGSGILKSDSPKDSYNLLKKIVEDDRE